MEVPSQEIASLRQQVEALRAKLAVAERRSAFLSKAGNVLGNSLDYQETLQRIVSLMVPELADWCAVIMAGAEDQLEPAAIAHADPERVRWTRRLHERCPLGPNAPHGAPKVIRTGESELYSDISEDMLADMARDEQHLQLIQKVGFTSSIVVPLQARGHILGALTLVSSHPDRPYTKADVPFAEDLARRAALAVDNARLYGQVQRARQKVQETQQEAEQAHRADSVFLARMSHEVRTPLTAITGFSSLLATEAEESNRQFAQLIERSSKRLLDTLNAVLKLSKLQAGRMDFQFDPLCIAEEAQKVIEIFRPQARQKGLDLTFDVPPYAQEARALLDEGAFSSILQNLLSNAIKFTDQGYVAVRVDADRQPAPGQVHLHIEDTGRGIDEDFRARLFTPFEQEATGNTDSGNTDSNEGKGSGLGLSIAKQLTKKMNGTIEVESTKGQGTHFTVSFPRAE